MLCSTKLLAVENEYTALPKQGVNTFNGMLCYVIDLKFALCLLSPFFWMSIVHAFFHSDGMVLDNQGICISLVRWGLMKGQPLKHIIDN